MRAWRLRRILFRLLALFFCLFRHFDRTDNDVGVAPFQLGLAFDLANPRKVLRKTEQQLAAKIGVSDFAASKLNNRLYPVSLLKESDGVILFKVVVVVIGIWPELQLFYLNDVLLLFSFVLPLFLLILPLAVIHRLCDWRFSGRTYDDKIESHLLRFPNSGRSWHNFDASVWKYSSYFAGANCLIYVLADFWPAWSETSWWIHAGLKGGAKARTAKRCE